MFEVDINGDSLGIEGLFLVFPSINRPWSGKDVAVVFATENVNHAVAAFAAITHERFKI